MNRDIVVVGVIALLALVIMSYAPDITGMAYSRTLGRTETWFAPAVQDCQANEDCPAGSSCRPYGALQRIRRKARTGCVPICEDSEQNRIPLAVFEQLKAAHDVTAITGFDPQKPKPTRYRPKNSFETFLYPSNCKDTLTVVEPFCVDAARDSATVATIEINCGAIGEEFGCVEDDNGDASCGQTGEGDDAQRLYAETGGSEAANEPTETSGEEIGAQETETAPEPPETGEQEAPPEEAEQPATPPEKKETPPSAPSASETAPTPTETAIEISDFQFTPAAISVPADTPTDIVVKNSGQATHTFTVEELGIDEELAVGEEKTVEISAPTGTYTGQCNFHPSMKITVRAE